MPKKPPEVRQKILETHQKLLNIKKTAKELGLSESWVGNVIRNENKKKALAAVPSSNTASSGDNVARGEKSTTKEMTEIIPHLGVTREDLKIIFSGFLANKKPSQIIAEYGFDPDIVGALYARYSKERNCDFVTFQRKELENFHAHSFEDLRYFEGISDTRGYLTVKEMFDFFQAVVEIQRKGALNMLFDNSDEEPPTGWAKIRCANCGEAFAIVNVSNNYGKAIINHYSGVRCGKCLPRF